MTANYFVTVDGEEFEVEVKGGAVFLNGEPVQADLMGSAESSSRGLLLDGCAHRIGVDRKGAGRWLLDLDRGPTEIEVLDRAGVAIRELTRKVAAQRGPEPLRAPMPGMVVKVDVEVGEVVQAGQAVVVVEAMKMENELQAGGEGRVAKVHVAPGAAVEKDAVLVEFASPDEEGEGANGGDADEPDA